MLLQYCQPQWMQQLCLFSDPHAHISAAAVSANGRPKVVIVAAQQCMQLWEAGQSSPLCHAACAHHAINPHYLVINAMTEMHNESLGAIRKVCQGTCVVLFCRQ